MCLWTDFRRVYPRPVVCCASPSFLENIRWSRSCPPASTQTPDDTHSVLELRETIDMILLPKLTLKSTFLFLSSSSCNQENTAKLSSKETLEPASCQFQGCTGDPASLSSPHSFPQKREALSPGRIRGDFSVLLPSPPLSPLYLVSETPPSKQKLLQTPISSNPGGGGEKGKASSFHIAVFGYCFMRTTSVRWQRECRAACADLNAGFICNSLSNLVPESLGFTSSHT
jgi:hypothetical protein